MCTVLAGRSVKIAVGRNCKRCRPGFAIRNHIERQISKSTRADAVRSGYPGVRQCHKQHDAVSIVGRGAFGVIIAPLAMDSAQIAFRSGITLRHYPDSNETLPAHPMISLPRRSLLNLRHVRAIANRLDVCASCRDRECHGLAARRC